MIRSCFLKLLTTLVVVISPSLSASAIAEVSDDTLSQGVDRLERLHNIVILHQGAVAFEYHNRGPAPTEAANIKSVSKSVISLITGIAIDKGYLSGLDQPISDVLGEHMPGNPPADLSQITIEHLLSMQSGLQRTSGQHYGTWVNSPNWTEYALTRPMVDEPGGDMLYSTGNSHILSAILQEQTGKNLFELTRDWLGTPLNVRIYPWQQAPEGVTFGGNDMMMSTHALAWFGQLYLDKGIANGQRVVSESWIDESFRPRTQSVYTDDPYGLGWFSYQFGDIQAFYGRGYGGQLIYVIPQLDLSIAMTSSPYPPSNGRYLQRQHRYIEDTVLPYFAGATN
ncbi:6-aminohexanoate hydrolase [Aliidiomarina maris]|uniref:6-aminohexanoate hydrolase n=1 Tax=Aliidiomarina maris TaxID=531312 RepID=A0ABY0BSH4_9GAMM|nr:6-aminohexanoate hydrolase [Aliidiomarina maris]